VSYVCFFALQLKNNKIHITQGETMSLLEKRNKALTELDERTAESLSKLDDKLYKLKQDLDDSKNTALADVENARTLVKQTQKVAISDITSARKKGIQNIAGKIDGALSEINSAKKQAKRQTKKYFFKAKHDIDGQKRKAISDIFHAKSDVLSAITKAGAEANEDFLIGASAAFPDTSSGMYFFPKGLRTFNKVSSLKLYYQVRFQHFMFIYITKSNDC
jgi:F0F1-type ATP synthase membrane subunit b/b'